MLEGDGAEGGLAPPPQADPRIVRVSARTVNLSLAAIIFNPPFYLISKGQTSGPELKDHYGKSHCRTNEHAFWRTTSSPRIENRELRRAGSLRFNPFLLG